MKKKSYNLQLKTYNCNQKGVAIVLTIIIMSLLLFLGMYFMSFSVTDLKISNSHSRAMRDYYLAEAGINEMIYRLKNDSNYTTNFETDPNWYQEFTRDNTFNAGSSYTVSIQNSDLGRGEITATGLISLNESIARRVVKTDAFKAVGQTTTNNATYADGNIDISASVVNFNNGSAHSNNVFTVNLWSAVNIGEQLNAVGNFNKSWMSAVTVNGNSANPCNDDVHSANCDPPGAAEEIEMPAIDFDSDDPGSYKNIANVVYTQSEFSDLMWANQNLTLTNPITYVEGDVYVRGGQILTINGLLVVERDFQISGCLWWKSWSQNRSGANDITVNYAPGQKSGILAKRKIYFSSCLDDININGVVYANDQIKITAPADNFNITGAAIARKLDITSVWSPVNINFDPDIVSDTIIISENSPVISIEHWEEEY